MNKKESANIYVIISVALGYIMSAVVPIIYNGSRLTAMDVNVLNIINNAVITLIPVAIFAFCNKSEFKSLFVKAPIKLSAKYLVLLPFIWMMSTYLNASVNNLLGKWGIDPITQLPPTEETAVIAVGFILTCIVAPLFEELFYRGVILSLLKGYGKGAAIIVSAFLFAIGHNSITIFVSPFVIGLFLGYVTIKCGSIYPAVLIHFIFNLISWILINGQLGQVANIVLSILVVTVGASASIYYTLKLLKHKEKITIVSLQLWQYAKNFLWLPILINYIYTNIINHG